MVLPDFDDEAVSSVEGTTQAFAEIMRLLPDKEEKREATVHDQPSNIMPFDEETKKPFPNKLDLMPNDMPLERPDPPSHSHSHSDSGSSHGYHHHDSGHSSHSVDSHSSYDAGSSHDSGSCDSSSSSSCD